MTRVSITAEQFAAAAKAAKERGVADNDNISHWRCVICKDVNVRWSDQKLASGERHMVVCPNGHTTRGYPVADFTTEHNDVQPCELSAPALAALLSVNDEGHLPDTMSRRVRDELAHHVLIGFKHYDGSGHYVPTVRGARLAEHALHLLIDR